MSVDSCPHQECGFTCRYVTRPRSYDPSLGELLKRSAGDHQESTTQYVTKDSGERREFGTGSRRDSDESKPLVRRIPPMVRERLGDLYRRGAAKYADLNDPQENWKKGQPLHEYLESAHRHLAKIEMGLEDEDHAAAVLWNVIAFMWTVDQIRKGKLPSRLADAFNEVVKEYDGLTVTTLDDKAT